MILVIRVSLPLGQDSTKANSSEESIPILLIGPSSNLKIPRLASFTVFT